MSNDNEAPDDALSDDEGLDPDDLEGLDGLEVDPDALDDDNDPEDEPEDDTDAGADEVTTGDGAKTRSEEHTSELQSH